MNPSELQNLSALTSTPPNRESSKGHAPRLDPRKVRAGAGTFFLVTLGLTVGALGALIQFGPEYVPNAEPVIDVLRSFGVELAFYLTGLGLGAMALMAHFQRQHTRTLMEPGVTDHTISEVGSDVEQLSQLMEELQSAQIKSGLEVGFLRQELRDHREDNRLSETKDALFRLAASLDQLGARIDQRIGVATAVLQDGLHEVNTMVEASREYLQESLDESVRHLSGAFYAGAPEVTQAALPPLPTEPIIEPIHGGGDEAIHDYGQALPEAVSQDADIEESSYEPEPVSLVLNNEPTPKSMTGLGPPRRPARRVDRGVDGPRRSEPLDTEPAAELESDGGPNVLRLEDD